MGNYAQRTILIAITFLQREIILCFLSTFDYTRKGRAPMVSLL